MNSDRISSEDLPSSASTAISEYRTYLRNITETLGVAWTASIPTGGTGYAQGDVLLVQDPKYKNCLLYTSPSPRDLSTSRMPSSA